MNNTFFRHSLCVLLFLIAGLSSMLAVPARPGWQTKTQPDGTPIVVQLMGDEFCHYWVTQDGKIATPQDDGTFVVTDEDIPTGKQVAKRRASSKRYQRRAKMVGAGYMPTRALFILVSFSDQTFKSTSETYYKSKLGDTSEGAMSMYNYLKLQSNGQYAPPVDVYGPYNVGKTYATYGANDSDGDDVNPAQMIVDACKAADADIDFSLYDGNNDGKVDNVYVLYAGKGEADGGAASTVWPHQWDIYYGGLTLNLDGKNIRAYACSAELNGSSQCAMGTPLHEFGHVIGLPDYYDTEYASTNYTEKRTPGDWSIMDGGSYNNDGNTPPNYSIFDKYYLGWETPKFLAKDEKKNVTMTTDWDDAYQITGGSSRVSATATSPATVYYIENRQKTGWDAYLPGHGMVVWQVKYNSTAWNKNNLNNTGGSPRYTVVSASGTATNIGKASDPFPGSSRVKSYTPVTGCAMTEITESGNNITFKFNGGISGHNVVASGTGCTIAPSATTVTNGTTLTATITPTDGTYDYTSITVKLGSTTLTNGTHYTLSSDKKTLTIKGTAITGAESNDLTITVVWTKNRYSYAMLGENCTEELEGTVAKNASLSLTITPNAGYTLADAACWEVTMGGNALTYGTGFTYNSSTNTFSIASVTGDLEIYAFGWHPVTWYADGSLVATNVAVDDKITLPAAPSDCASGKKFVGWCTNGSYSSATTAPTFANDGDDYSVATYYAVYATTGNGGSSAKSYTFNITTSDFNTTSYAANDNEKTSTATASDASTMDVKWTSANVMKSSNNMQWKKSAGIIYNSTDLGTIKSVTITSSGGSFTTYYGDSEQPSTSTTVGGGYFQIKVGSTTGIASNIAITFEKTISGGSASYSDYSTSCGSLCSNTPTMSFSPTTVDKTTADVSFTKTVTISGKGSGQTVTYSSSDETIATVNNSGVVTLKGKVGSTTITASVEADGDYCAASASYTLNVAAAPINVTLYYSGTSTTLSNQTNPYTLPTTGDYVATMCEGDWTFAGWYSSAYTKSTTAPTYITQLSASGSAYAVYTTTESEASAPARAKAAESGSVTITTSTTNIPTSYGSANTFTEYTLEGYKFKVQQMYLNSGKLQWRAEGNNSGTGTMYNTQTFPSKITSIVLSYNSSDINKNFTVKVGSSENPTSGTSIEPSVSNLIYTFDCSSANADYFVLTNGSGAGYLDQIVINYGGSGGSATTTTYYATTPDCAVVCNLTSITLNTSSAKKTFYVGDSFTHDGVVITANYSNCDSKTVNGFYTVPDMTTTGNKTVNISYTENGVTKNASYEITVSALVTYTVTWVVCGDIIQTDTYNDGAHLAFPTTPGANAGKTFYGWTTTEHYTGTSAPPIISEGGEVHANATYYAVYK